MSIKTFLIGPKHPYGEPYKPIIRVFPWVPEILTIWWWRQCFAHGYPLGRDRLRLYWKRHILSRLVKWMMQPICLIKGHDMNHSSDWSYSCDCCGRCRRRWNFKRN